MTPSETVGRFLAEASPGQEILLPAPSGLLTCSDLFPERVGGSCARCGVERCWRRTVCPSEPVQSFASLVYDCGNCEGKVGLYLVIRWLADRTAVTLRMAARFLPPGQVSTPDP